MMALYGTLFSLLIVSGCATAASYPRFQTYTRGREARLVPRSTFRTRGRSSGGYGGQQTDTYNGGSTDSGYTPQQIPTQGGFVAGQGAYYGASAPFIDYYNTPIDIPVPTIEIPRFHLPTLPGGPPPLFLPTIDIPTVPYPHIDVPRIPPIHPPHVNFPPIPPVEGIDIPYPSVRFIKEKWQGSNSGGYGGGGSGYGGGGGGNGALYKRTGKVGKSIAKASLLSARSSLKEVETREVPITVQTTRQVEIREPSVVASVEPVKVA